MCLLTDILFLRYPMETNAGIIALIDKMLDEATSSEEETLFVSTRLKNDIIVSKKVVMLSIGTSEGTKIECYVLL